MLPAPDGPVTGGSPVTLWMLASCISVHIFGGGKYQSQISGLMIDPWEIFLLCHAATVGVFWLVRPDLVFVIREGQRGDYLHVSSDICYVVIYWRPTLELLSLMAVMSERLGFNLCVVPFLNICVPNLLQGVKSRECQRWSELGQRCHTRVRWRETKLGS